MELIVECNFFEFGESYLCTKKRLEGERVVLRSRAEESMP